MASNSTHDIKGDFKQFITHLRLEALSLALLMVALTYVSDYSLWWILIGFPLVDICIVGYAFGPKVGAVTYNLLHNSTIPTLLITIGVLYDKPLVSLVGFVWTFHTALDRVLGYGLKHKHSFQETHLGSLKKPNKSN